VGEIIWGKNPKSILDIGVGFGMWGALFRAWTDIRMAELNPERYGKTGWATLIEGIEIHEQYKSPLWECYDKVYIGDAMDNLVANGMVNMLSKGVNPYLYDHIHLGDVIEHMDKTPGRELLRLCLEHLNPGGSITVVTPNGYRAQGPVLGNEHERHQCGWETKDLVDEGATHVWETKPHNMLVAAFQS
jgi:hypothetical protein